MIIKHDKSYIGASEALIDRGYAELDIHSITLEGNTVEGGSYKDLLPIYDWLKEGDYKVRQLNIEGRQEHDLHFYSNKGWNNKEHFDFFQISPNKDRPVEENIKLINELVETIDKMTDNKVDCRVQYTVRVDKERLEGKSDAICLQLEDKFINYRGMEGKIKVVSDSKGKKQYGFFKKRARTNFYRIAHDYMVLNFQ